jgi:hypothetical protein
MDHPRLSNRGREIQEEKDRPRKEREQAIKGVEDLLEEEENS